MLIRRDCGFCALGTTTVKTPFFRLAFTLSWSTRAGKLNDRWNSPTERSITQNFSEALDTSLLLSPVFLRVWPVLLLVPPASLTVDFWYSFASEFSASSMAPWCAAGLVVGLNSTEYCQCVRVGPLKVNILLIESR